MKASELRNKSIDELQTELLGLTREQFNLRMQKAYGQSKQTHQFKEVRKSIARIKTLLKEKSGVSS